MDTNVVKVLSKRDIDALLGRNEGKTPIAFVKSYSTDLKTNLLTPSRNQSYSCCIEWVSRWFYSKFSDNFFKQKHLEIEHILNQRLHYRTRDLLVTNKPAVSISVNMDNNYNRELLDQYNYGADLYSNRARYRDVFFRDTDRSLGIALTMEMLLLNFSFKMLFAEQGIQMDVANRVNLLFRSGATQKSYADIDYHIPEELLIQLAEDTNNFVCPCTGKILDAEAFVRYFNQHSQLILYYKFDASKHKMQYFLRIPHCVIHIKVNEVQVNEGDRMGNIRNNFEVSFDCQVRFPSPKFYAYLSLKERADTLCISQLDERSFGVLVSSLAQVPDKNEKGWARKVETMYVFDEPKEVLAIKNGEHMHIDFGEMIGDLRNAIELTKSMAISPDAFLDLRVYNYFKRVPVSIDWNAYRINFLDKISSCECCIVLYIDGGYYANIVTALKEYDKNRIISSGTQTDPITHPELKNTTSIEPDGKAPTNVIDQSVSQCPIKKNVYEE